MKFTELNPRLAENVLVFDCPCDRCAAIRKNPNAPAFATLMDARIRIPIKPVTNGWDHVSGTFPETLTLLPSILIEHRPSGGWHGYLQNGILVPC